MTKSRINHAINLSNHPLTKWGKIQILATNAQMLQ